MNIQNSTILTEKFPKLFRGIFEERKKWAQNKAFGPIAFGFECGDGWFGLIYRLAEKLEAIISKLPEEEQCHVYASQVKEKFGTLRFYMSSGTDEIYDLISEAENKSYCICEGCSKPSITLGQGWIVNLCRDCYIAYAEDRNGINKKEAGEYWDASKKKKDRREAALIRVNRLRAAKGLESRQW